MDDSLEVDDVGGVGGKSGGGEGGVFERVGPPGGAVVNAQGVECAVGGGEDRARSFWTAMGETTPPGRSFFQRGLPERSKAWMEPLPGSSLGSKRMEEQPTRMVLPETVGPAQGLWGRSVDQILEPSLVERQKRDALADLFVVEEGGGDKELVADDGGGGVDVPLVLANLPEEFWLGFGEGVFIGGHREVGVFDFVFFVLFLKLLPFRFNALLSGFGCRRLAVENEHIQVDTEEAAGTCSDVNLALSDHRRAFEVNERAGHLTLPDGRAGGGHETVKVAAVGLVDAVAEDNFSARDRGRAVKGLLEVRGTFAPDGLDRALTVEGEGEE